MSEPVREAFMILLVGMSSVFVILSLVVLTGNMLIRFLKASNFMFNKEHQSSSVESIPQELIEQAILKWSDGKATIQNIQKL